MAEQTGFIKITGTVNGICFYRLHGKYYARLKSSLSGERVQRSPAFENTMKYAGLLAKASVIASDVYNMLPKEKKERKIYQRLVGMGMRLFKEGTRKEEVIEVLKKYLIVLFFIFFFL